MEFRRALPPVPQLKADFTMPQPFHLSILHHIAHDLLHQLSIRLYSYPY